MAARAAIRKVIGTDIELNMLGIDMTNTYGSNAVDTPDKTRPFVEFRVDSLGKAFGATGAYGLSVWVHVPKDVERDYGRIDHALRRIRDLLLGAIEVSGEDGWILTSAAWEGESGDLEDDGYATLTRHADFRIACRQPDFG
jgi:hypothetical protein